MTQTNNTQEQARQQFENVQEQARTQFEVAQNLATASAQTWNQLLATSTDAAFDVVLRNWDYSKSVRDSTEQALENTIKRQREVSAEMVRVWQGYTRSVTEAVNKSSR
ncbi:MAG: hypothetical protein M3Q29_05190 [Chloroflexota bacterium]|nr:hypothetical protein [Chloroflexota bacterium]